MKFLLTPFPRPKPNKRNLISVILLGVSGSTFILLFKPFNIVNPTGELYLDAILFSLGLLFSLSIITIEFGIPMLFPKPFKKWTLGKAIAWYTIVILFVSGTIFLYKSYLGGFRDFTWLEYFFVMGRVLSITLTVSFFTLGMISYFNRKKFSLISSEQSYTITSLQSKPIKLQLDQILYIVSDDNYVDIHLEIDGKRTKEVFRSSLKNMEEQLVNPVSPIYRCHRQYLININHFKLQKKSSKSMSISLERYGDEIPVSKQYITAIGKLIDE